MAIQVSVIGSGAEHEARAEQVGRLLAERGCTVVCGGRGEVMAAAARGAKAAGGTTIGILPSTDRRDANEWIDHVVCTGLGYARIFGRPVVILEPGLEVEGVPRAATPADAVELVLAALDTNPGKD